jgi:hypothetical protein
MSSKSIKDILKEEFGWEIPVETVPLPSLGKLYDPDSTLYMRETVDIKAMTAEEEDILTSTALIKKGETISKLIESCVVDKSFNPESLLIGDRNALMVAIRITGYGTQYPVVYACGNCGTQNKVDVDLSTLPIKTLEINPVKSGANEFKYTLPVTKKDVTFKFMTGLDEKERKVTQERMKKLLGGDSDLENNVTSSLEACVISIDGVTDKLKIKHFIKYMPAYDSKSLRKFIRDNEPNIEMVQNCTCSNCGTAADINVPVTTEFFWPNT